MILEPLTFGISVIARETARDWSQVRRLLGFTLKSVRAQEGGGCRTVVAAHDRLDLDDPNAELLLADWPAPGRGDHLGQMVDAGRKQQLVQRRTLERGGGLLMLLDADDWVETGFVRAARAALSDRDAVGGLVERGPLVDIGAMRTAAIPDPTIVAKPFHEVCGSCGVFRLRPEETDPFRRNPLSRLPLHHRWREEARSLGVQLAALPAEAAYVVGTGQNNSETVGPHTAWRRGVTAEIARRGTPLDAAFAARFGQDLTALRADTNMASSDRHAGRL